MKNIVFQLIIILSIIIPVTSCSQDDIDGGGNRYSTTNAVTIKSGMSTKAMDAQWESGDAIGVTMYNTDYSAVLNGQFNYQYVTNSSDELGIFNPNSVSDTLYFPQNGDDMRLVAYYPYTSALPSDLKLPWSVSDQSELPEIDLMTAEHQKGFSKTDQDVELHFYHRLSKLIFNMSIEGDGDFVSLEDCDLVLKGMETGNTYDILNNVFLDAGMGVDDIDVPLRDGQAGSQRTAIVLPRVADEGVQFQFTAPNGDTYIANMSDTLDLTGGYQYTFNILFKKNPVTVSATIEPWIMYQPQYYENLLVSTPAGDSKGVNVGDIMNVYLQDSITPDFALLRRFIYQDTDEWEAETPVYWEEIEQNPAVLRASIIAAPALNGTQMPDILIADQISIPRHTGANFELHHAGSKVIVRLISQYFSSEELDAATITLPNYLTGGYEQLGEFIEGTTRANITVDRTDPDNSIAIFQPQYIGGSDILVTTTINGRPYHAYDHNGFTFEEGTAYELIVILYKEGVSVSARVIDWLEETVTLDAVSIGQSENGAINVLDGEQLKVYIGDDISRDSLNTFVYTAALDTFFTARPTYWESLPDPTTFYGYIKRHEKYNDTQLDDNITGLPVTQVPSNGVHFELSHASAQVVVQLTSNDGTFSNDELTAMEMTLPNYIVGGYMDNGIFVPGSTPGNVTVAKNVGDNEDSAIALIQPQTVTSGDKVIEIKSPVRTYPVTYDQNIVYDAGKTTKLLIDMSKTALTLSADVTDWIDDQTIPLVPQAIEVTGTLENTDGFFDNKTIYIYKLDGSSISDYSYIYNGTQWQGGPIYWDDQLSASMNLTAIYSPTGAPILSGASFPWTIGVNQSGGYTNYDLLSSHLLLPTPQVANFVFTHATSKVTIKLIPGTGFQQSDFIGSEITLNDFSLSGSLNLATGNITGVSGSSTVNPYTETDGTEYSALVMPQLKNSGDNVLTITLPGFSATPFTGTLDNNVAFQAGHETFIEVTLSKTAIQLSATLRPWQEGDTGNITIK